MEIVLLKLGLSAILGMAIGLEREMKHKPAGVKTAIIISVIACLLTIISIESAVSYHNTFKTNVDPMRLAAQIVSGIGFLGAGVILIRKNESITGLTTAAMMWGAAGFGIAAGAGFFKEAIAGILLILFSVKFIPYLIKLVGPKSLREKEIRLLLVVKPECYLTQLLKDIKAKEISIENVKVKDLEGELKSVELKISVNEKRYTTDVYDAVKMIDPILSVEIESL